MTFDVMQNLFMFVYRYLKDDCGQAFERSPVPCTIGVGGIPILVVNHGMKSSPVTYRYIKLL